jgi:hypothetical protein
MDFKFLSYSSLSTPHNGSAGADLLVQRSIALGVTSDIEFVGFPLFTQSVVEQTTLDAGTPNLTTTFLAGFNTSNLSRLPSNAVFNTVAADADTNGNAGIDRSPDEYAELRAESQQLRDLDSSGILGPTKTRIAVNAAYQILRRTQSVTLTYRTERRFIFFGELRTIAVLTSMPNAQQLGNDVLVTIPSGQGLGTGGFASRVTNTTTFTGAAGRNHSNIADAGVAARVVPWIIEIERTRGDLK